MGRPLDRFAPGVRRLLLGLLVVLALPATPLHAADPPLPEEPAGEGGLAPLVGADHAAFVSPPAEPTEVRVGLYLLGLSDVDPPSEAFPSFEAEMFLDLLWRDPRLAFDPEEEGVARKTYQDHAVEVELDEIWWPNFDLENGEGNRKVQARSLVIEPDGTVEYTERFESRFHGEVDLRKFPFDEQVFEIQLESFSWDERFLELVPYEERIGFDEDFHTPEWDLVDVSAAVASRKEVRSRTSFSRLAFGIHVERRSGYYLWKLLLPMLLIVGFTWSSFWMTGEATGTRMQRSFIAMLTLVAFYQVLAGNLPRISYLTFLDGVAFLAFASVGITLVQIILAHRAAQRGMTDRAERLDRTARWLVPAFFLGCLAVLWVVFH
ncbi:MAG: hypothetical protein ACODAU_11715 [Myxococcota bacterium]